jgi:PTH2 family peptidyl-tRNA hydrolase
MKLLESTIYYVLGIASGIAIALTSSRAKGPGGSRPGPASSGRDDVKMVLVCNTSLKMGKGKIAAQCAHAACGAVETANETLLRQWRNAGQKKIALAASEAEVLQLHRQLKSAGVNCCLVADAGKTQIAAGSKTVLGIGPDTEERIDRFTARLRLL